MPALTVVGSSMSSTVTAAWAMVGVGCAIFMFCGIAIDGLGAGLDNAFDLRPFTAAGQNPQKITVKCISGVRRRTSAPAGAASVDA